MIKALIFLLSIFSSFSYIEAYVSPARIYIDSEEMETNEDRFRIHLGQNVWIEANAMYRDESGMYTLDANVLRGLTNQYEKKWKCPYCYRYWPIGRACENKDCPSRFK